MKNKPTLEKLRYPRTPVTMRNVAKEAGVSISTVSKALNGTGQLGAETRRAVSEVAKRLGFRPNDLAQSLHRGRTFSVGILSNDIYGRFTLPIVGGIEEALSDNRVSVFLCNSADDPGKQQRHLDALLAKRIDGLILTARRTDYHTPLDIAALGIPVVHAYARSSDPNAICILPDDEGGARDAVRHLLNLGRKHIAYVGGPEDFEATRLRHAGYRTALREAGITPAAGLELNGPWSEEWGREAAARLIKKSSALPDAIVCGSDQIARGMADGLREGGVTVPTQIALVGFDNWDVIAAATRPSLTTVDPNLKTLGAEAGLTLLSMIEGKEPAPGIRRIASTLIVRRSCGTPRRP